MMIVIGILLLLIQASVGLKFLNAPYQPVECSETPPLLRLIGGVTDPQALATPSVLLTNSTGTSTQLFSLLGTASLFNNAGLQLFNSTTGIRSTTNVNFALCNGLQTFVATVTLPYVANLAIPIAHLGLGKGHMPTLKTLFVLIDKAQRSQLCKHRCLALRYDWMLCRHVYRQPEPKYIHHVRMLPRHSSGEGGCPTMPPPSM